MHMGGQDWDEVRACGHVMCCVGGIALRHTPPRHHPRPLLAGPQVVIRKKRPTNASLKDESVSVPQRAARLLLAITLAVGAPSVPSMLTPVPGTHSPPVGLLPPHPRRQ